MEINEELAVYNTVHTVFPKHAGAKLLSAKMSEKELRQRMEAYGYAVVKFNLADRHGERIFYVFIIGLASFRGQKAAEFESMINAEKIDFAKSEILIIINQSEDTEDIVKSNIETKIAAIKKSNNNVIIDLAPYKCFIFDITTHVLSQKHELATKEEIKTFLDESCKMKTDFDIIRYSDPQIIYMRARQDDIIKILRIMPTCAYQIEYRRVVGGIYRAAK